MDMNLNRFLLFAIAACLISPANAEEHKKMMSYYVRSAPQTGETAKAPAPNTAPRQTLKINSIKNAPPGEAEPVPQSIQKESAEAAWARYKALSTGEQPAPQKIPDPLPPQNAAIPAQPEIATTGINGLLNQYQSSKAKRSQMNTLRVSPAHAINPASAGQ